MRRTWYVLAICALLGIAPIACAQDRGGREQDLAALAAYRAGKYDDALGAAERAIRTDSADAVAAEVMLRSLYDVGKYAEAVSKGEALATRAGSSIGSAIGNTLGDAHRSRGALVEAKRSYERALVGRDSLTAKLNLARLAFDRGERDAAGRSFDAFIDVYNRQRRALSAHDLRAVAIAMRYLGRTDPQMYKDALRAFDEAIAVDSNDLEPRVELGTLFLDKFNSVEARKSFDEVLKRNPHHPRALLGMARVRYFDGQGDASELVRQSLAVNPADANARAFSALLLLDVERYADAASEAIRGLTADTTSPAPLVALAAARFLSGDTANFQRALARAHTRLEGAADAEIVLADVAARNRLYRQAADFAAQGVARDPRAARALALLGINQLRIGRIAEGKGNLDRAFAADPYDVWAKNTLDLLDTFKDYAELSTPRFVIAAEKKDAALLELYVGPLAEEAFDSLTARYAFKPQTPVRVELFRSHADFSVRTVGLAGLGALGVSFGNVVAMDSPAARKVGEFNWGSTLWHELAHTFTLGLSGNKVPRWVSEGLSVYEERRARKGWGSDITPSFVAAFKGKLLRPPSQMNDGFMRPRFPEEVILSYYQASLVCEMIEREKGIAGIRALLAAYGRGATTERGVKEVLGYDLATFDSRFDAFVRQRFARELSSVDLEKSSRAAEKSPDESGGGIEWGGAFTDAMRAATTLAERQEWDAAVKELERAKSLFPSYAGDDSPYRTLAKIHATR
ncbi:MAG: tetratricopeptide repeat protein, partial [Gemmatimonadaceae bacterium]